MLRTLAALFFLSGAALAEDCPVLELDGPVKSIRTAGYIGALLDPDWQLDLADVTGTAAERFSLLDTHIPGFGYTRSRIWLRICARNAMDDVSQWRFYAHENFFQVYDLYVAHADGRTDTAIRLRPDSTFSERPIDDPELIAPMAILPGETVTIYISYWSGGSSQLDFSIETKDSYDAIAARKTAKNFFFYGMMILLMVVALISFIIFRHPVFIFYIAYSASALLIVMHGDGVAFQYLWPGFPAFNNNASIVTGSALIVFGTVYARVFLRTRTRHRRTDKVLLGFFLVTLALDAVLFSLDPQLLKKLLVMLSLGAFLTFTFAGFISYFSGYKEVRFYLIAWFGVVLASTMMNLRHFFGVEISQEAVRDSMRAVMVFDAMMMGLAIADRYNQLRKSRQRALEENLTTAQQHLDLNQRFSDLQTRHELAVEMSRTRDHDFQNVIHDLRQPLHALRLSILTLGSDRQASAGAALNIESSFTYLEDLISEHLDAVTGRPALEQSDATQDQPGLQEILTAVEEMFTPDAEEKGLSLRLVRSGLDAPVNPLLLTRIVSNLVANAIKYTDAGGVLIGTRKRGKTIRIEVHDSGAGMTPAEFDQARKRSARLERDRSRAPGSGLGLSIAMELARRHGMKIELSPLRRTGTGVAIVI